LLVLWTISTRPVPLGPRHGLGVRQALLDALKLGDGHGEQDCPYRQDQSLSSGRTAATRGMPDAIHSSAVEEGHVPVPGGRVFYRRLSGGGEGLPLLVVHGGPGFTHDYLEVLERLADRRDVIFFDQLGSGRSDRPADEGLWRLQRFVDEVDAVRTGLGVDRMHLLGQSWGGCLATTYALTVPDPITSLVLASPLISVPRWLEDAARLRAALPDEVRATLDSHEAGGRTGCPEYAAATVFFYKRHFCRLEPWPDPLERTFAGMSQEVYETMWGPTEFHCTGTLRGYDLTPRLPEIRVPTLFTCGRHDEATPEAMAAFREMVPGADLVVFERSSHTAHLEETDRFLREVDAFLQRVDP
jgi:proline iminopeptidase